MDAPRTEIRTWMDNEGCHDFQKRVAIKSMNHAIIYDYGVKKFEEL